MPYDFGLKAMNTVHRIVLTLSRGKIGWSAMGMPVLELTTIGRRSGKARSTMLTSPLQEGNSYVVVASRGGDDRHPAWLLNLRDEPRVEVSIQGAPARPMLARIASPTERARLWPRITENYSTYAGYQERTDREIPLVVLDPLP